MESLVWTFRAPILSILLERRGPRGRNGSEHRGSATEYWVKHSHTDRRAAKLELPRRQHSGKTTFLKTPCREPGKGNYLPLGRVESHARTDESRTGQRRARRVDSPKRALPQLPFQ